MKRLGMLLGTVAVAALLAGCGGGAGSSTTTTTASAENQVKAAMQQKADQEEREDAVTRSNEEVSEARAKSEKKKADQRAADDRVEELHRRVERELEDLEQEEQAAEESVPVTPGEVTKAEFGKKWPLTVSHGTLSCDGSAGVGSVVFTAPDGTRYGLNGTAQDQEGLPAIDPIWLYEPGMKRYGLKINIGPLIDRGLALC